MKYQVGNISQQGIPNVKLEKETVDLIVRANSINNIIDIFLLYIRQ